MPDSHAFDAIPTIDISGLYDPDVRVRQRTADALGQAATDVGFLYVRGHRIPATLSDSLIECAQAYFARDAAAKQRDYIGLSDNHSGYVPEGEEQFYGGKTDRKEAFDIGFDIACQPQQRPLLGRNRWPAIPGFRETVSAYYAAAFDLGQVLFRGFALALGLPENALVRHVTAPPSQLRLVHYPFDPEAQADAEGIGAHTDYECFTLLLPTSDGLEVLSGDGRWIDAPAREGSLVVNIGDMLEIISHGRFKATAHRVRRVSEERYSFPMFCALDYDTLVEPMVPAASPDKIYTPLICGEHIFAQTVQTFRYLQERLARGEISLPDNTHALSSFGHLAAGKQEGARASR